MNTITPRNDTKALLHEKFQALAAETLEKKFQDRINAAKPTAASGKDDGLVCRSLFRPMETLLE
jgi:hypothetical protein